MLSTRAFVAFGGVPRRGVYDNMKTAVDRVSRHRERTVNARSQALCSHYLFEPEFCNRAAGWEKGILLVDIGAPPLTTVRPATIGHWAPSVYDAPPITAPYGLSAAPTVGGVVLRWMAIEHADAIYEVQRADDIDGSPGTAIGGSVTRDREYRSNESALTHWRVRAAVHGRVSPWSAWVSQAPGTADDLLDGASYARLARVDTVSVLALYAVARHFYTAQIDGRADGFALALVHATRASLASDTDSAAMRRVAAEATDLVDQISRTMDLAVQLADPAPALRKVDELEKKRADALLRLQELQTKAERAAWVSDVGVADVASALASLVAVAKETGRSDWLRPVIASVVERVELDPRSLTGSICYRVTPAMPGVKLASPRDAVLNPHFLEYHRPIAIVPYKRRWQAA